jgi:NADPH:quinone reductase-like Zn-dependent oxidoreductase
VLERLGEQLFLGGKRRYRVAGYGFAAGHVLGGEVAGVVTAVGPGATCRGSVRASGPPPVWAAGMPSTTAAGLLGAVGRGEVDTVVHDVLPLAQAALAHRKLDAGEVFGRLALVPA